ncbi:EAL domain-containing protein [Demequina sp. TTPB684]|uniref:EAL domain-containing protein n=1 Tax=unclassified Demequina TaxID=2620311 RepID=UPI001CF44947|nr:MULTISPECIES: EAL domain-containing protein [unclassified Demequina]MCB2413854.1 EAL domain-containing protein [Demequina sp. TTPB684]UPU89166.1 EAL domain-containing protein [Demequina sp. TMPB413]
MTESSDSAPSASDEFAAILNERQVTSVFQPIVDLATGEVVGYEALCRGPEGSRFGSPAELFRQAELDGLQSMLNWICLGSAFEGFFSAGAPRSASLFVNMSVGLRIDQCPPDIYEIVARAQSSLRVFIELNDAALASDPEGVLATVDRARQLSWGVSVDDVSSSPGCLSVLPLLSADVVKLDMRMLQRDSPGGFAPSLGPLLKYVEANRVTLIVTGIETAAEAKLARALGATLGQGYRFGRPEALSGPLATPRTVVPLLDVVRHSPRNTSLRDIIEDHPSQTMTAESLLEIGGFFLRQAMTARSRPVVLIRQPNGLALDAVFHVGTLDQLRETAVLCAIFGPHGASKILPGWRHVVVSPGDPLRNRAFLILLTDSLTVGIVATRWMPHEELFDVVLTQDATTVYRLADHLIRRMPSEHGDEIVRFDSGED